MENKRKCEICGKEIIVRKERITRNINGKDIVSQILVSDEGVYFEEGQAWFCSDCWADLTDPIFERLNRELPKDL